MVKRDVNVNWASLINSHFTKSRIFNKSLSVLVGKTQTFYDLYVLILHTVIGVSNQCSPPAIWTSSSFLHYCFSSQPIQQIYITVDSVDVTHSLASDQWTASNAVTVQYSSKVRFHIIFPLSIIIVSQI